MAASDPPFKRRGHARGPQPAVRHEAQGEAGASGWKQDPDAVRRNILETARRAFVDKGLSGARIDAIAAGTATSKRMIYYYFGDKEGLYRAVLEDAYTRIRRLEQSLDLGALEPMDALRALTGLTFDYHADNPDFVRLVMIENIHHARHLKTSQQIGALNHTAIDMLADIYARGLEDGVFRAGIAPIDLHLTISALSFYNVSNQLPIRQIFGHDMAQPGVRTRRRAMVIETVLRHVRVVEADRSEANG